MKAIEYRQYGPPEVLAFRDVDPPVIQDHEILVRVGAAAINPLDWHFMRGTPYLLRLMIGLRRPKVPGLGVDVAGRVEAVGSKVERFRPGDEVFGLAKGALAEYARSSEATLALKPANLSFEQAAAVPIAAMTALQGLRDQGRIRPGCRVLVNGASGGVGSFAVQIAKALGAEVTGVCSTRNLDLVRSLGAGQVVDYTREDFTRLGQRYDLIFDTIGNHTVSAMRRVLEPKGVLVMAGAARMGDWLEPLVSPLMTLVQSWFVSQTLAPFLAKGRQEDLVVLKDLIEAGKVTPVIDRTYPLSEAPEAIRYLEGGHARGKVVITVWKADQT
ncbi:MAG TPA: NAD(P)-dependent alcohol dehydrogenase [Holophagaceae bacterium]|nr:NAD(P)-dependent alcohol dehydrogenase [Holophagaceae bacterium]